MTKEEWAKIEKSLSRNYGKVDLKIDGFDVTIAIEPYEALKNVLAV